MKIYCGFPGIGKSHLFKWHPNMFLDTDSSLFSKDKEFPNNYLAHMQANQSNKIQLCSTHQVVRKALFEKGIPYVLVYPQRNCKEEYLQRYKQRRSPEAFIALMEKQWDNFLDELENDKGCVNRQVLGPKEYLSIYHFQ